MTGFYVVAHLAPAAAAFLAPALLEARPGWKAAAFGHGAVLAVLILAGLVAGAGVSTVLLCAIFATAFALLAVGVHLAAGQVASGLVVVLLLAGPAIGAPWAREAIDRGEDASDRVGLLLTLSPFAVQDASLLGRDVLRERVLYSTTHFADYLPTVRYPKWGPVAGTYVAAGLLLGALGLVRRGRRVAP